MELEIEEALNMMKGKKKMNRDEIINYLKSERQQAKENYDYALEYHLSNQIVAETRAIWSMLNKIIEEIEEGN